MKKVATHATISAMLVKSNNSDRVLTAFVTPEEELALKPSDVAA